MATKPSKSGDLRGAAAASHEKAEKDKATTDKAGSKSAGSAKPAKKKSR